MVLVLGPGDKINIHGELKEFYLDYRAVGSEFNEQYSEIRQRYIEKTSEAVRLELEIDTLMFNNGDSELINELFQKRNEIGRIASAEHLTYIKNNWDKDLSAYFLARQPLDTLGRYYANLAPDVREGIFYNILENLYLQFQRYSIAKESEQNLTVGSAAPDFTLEKPDGTKFTLSSLRHSYIVVYFWGSWCPPCIREFPKMKEYYHKYNNEVEFVGISHGDSDEEWRKAVEEHSLDWIQVINNPDVHIDVPAKYGVMAYPTKFILDEDLKILGKYIGASDDFYTKLDKITKRSGS
jgi:peroxiredoxin